MENNFELLISSLLDSKIGFSNQFLSDSLANDLKSNLLSLCDKQKFKSAGVGNTENLIQNKNVRSDEIYWLDRKHENQSQNDFLDLMDEFVQYMNMTCYTGITDYEFHYSMFEKGAFYSKHLDQFQQNSNRKYSMISYLNADWQTEDGGELLIHQTEGNTTIEPKQGNTVFFKSDEIEHEVLVTQTRRMSITGWLKG